MRKIIMSLVVATVAIIGIGLATELGSVDAKVGNINPTTSPTPCWSTKNGPCIPLPTPTPAATATPTPTPTPTPIATPSPTPEPPCGEKERRPGFTITSTEKYEAFDLTENDLLDVLRLMRIQGFDDIRIERDGELWSVYAERTIN